MTKHQKKQIIVIALLLASIAIGVIAWQKYAKTGNDKVIVSGNGRIEAVEIDIATKASGRVKDILAHEGDFVTAGQVLALMDVEVLEAQLRQAQAQLKQAQASVETARSQMAQRESEKAAAQSLVIQRDAELANARKHATRAAELLERNFISRQEAEDDSARVEGAAAAASAARAQVAAAEATIATAKAQILGAESAAAAAKAMLERIEADIRDSSLKSPRNGRVQYLVAQPGEVLSAGGKVLSLVDLSDVYMTFFLPTVAAGRVALGSEIRLILDAAPQYVIPAQASFVADVAQFTPKTVETANEREKLMFRVRAKISEDILRKYIMKVKTGLPGVAYVRLNPSVPWPSNLQVKLPR